jgi:putative ABC transport system permease protein
MFTIILENILNSFESIRSNKMRSGLSMLGIIIGVSSVIILTALGNGSTQSIQSRLSEMWTNILTLSTWWFGWSRSTNTATNILTEKVVKWLQDNISWLDGVVPLINSNGQLKYGRNDMSAQVYGIDTTYMKVKNIDIVAGRSITDTDINELAKVAVLGQEIVKELFDGENPIGQKIKMGKNSFEVIGVIEENSTHGSIFFIPLSTASVRITGQKYYSQIIIPVTNATEVTAKQTEIDAYLQKVLEVTNPDNLPYRLRNQSEMLQNITSITQTLTMLLSGIAGISLLVGGIGIMNIMLVSVTERTKEIGIRKAIGAAKSDILIQFLTEATSLSILGGIIGILISYWVVSLFNYFSITALISSSSILMSFAFSLWVGLIFGILPAYKAAKLRPIDALRFE